MTLTYKGKDQIKTLIGGLISIVIKVITLAIVMKLTITIFSRSNTTTTINKIFKDVTNDKTKHYFAKDNIYFAFRESNNLI